MMSQDENTISNIMRKNCAGIMIIPCVHAILHFYQQIYVYTGKRMF
jgi:hypothetical protein